MGNDIKGRVLLVDDSPAIQKVGAKILASKGFKISLANNGQDALKLFGNNAFDLIVLDYHMPKLNGQQVVNVIRNSTNSMSSYNVPILMLSGESDQNIVNQLLESGANDYIYKKNLLKAPEIFLEKVFELLKFQEELVKYKKMKLQRTLSPVVLSFYRFGKEFIKRYIEKREISKMMMLKLNDELDAIKNSMEEGEIIELIYETPEAEDFLAAHSVNSAILTIYFCSFSLEWEWEKIKQVTAGAFLHDFGNLDEDLMFIKNPTELQEHEFQRYRKHVGFSMDVARNAGLDEMALEYIKNHHERSNGSGYPARRKEDEMSDIGMIAAIIDTFDALTFSRGVHKKMLAKEAIRRMKSWGNQYSKKYLLQFEEMTQQLEFKQESL